VLPLQGVNIDEGHSEPPARTSPSQATPAAGVEDYKGDSPRTSPLPFLPSPSAIPSPSAFARTLPMAHAPSLLTSSPSHPQMTPSRLSLSLASALTWLPSHWAQKPARSIVPRNVYLDSDVN
jgi:hypothetical protein